MPTLPTKTRDQLIIDAVVAAQAAADSALEFPVGSVTLALVEADVANWLFIQSLVVLLAAAIRLSTSKGTDVDTFIADFGLKRLAAQKSSGNLMFSRFDNTQTAYVPVDGLTTTDTNLQFIVIADSANPNYDPVNKRYIVSAGIANISVPAQAVVAGADGNVSANTINLIASAMPGIDTVNNAAPFVNGSDKESDDAVKKRFALYFASLFRATLEAIEYAITITEDNLKYKLTEQKDYNTDAESLGEFYAVVDEGQGNLDDQTKQNVLANINRYRAFGIKPAVYAPIKVHVTIVGVLSMPSYVDSASFISQTEDAIAEFINAFNPGDPLIYYKLPCIIEELSMALDADVIVDSLTVNGTTTNITPNDKQAIVLDDITLTAS